MPEEVCFVQHAGSVLAGPKGVCRRQFRCPSETMGCFDLNEAENRLI
jgi:hypothetical protein